MQTQDLPGLTWSDNEATAVHHPSTINNHNDLIPAIGNFQGDGSNTEDRQHREQRREKLKAQINGLRNEIARLRLEIRELRIEPQQGSARIWEMMGRFWWELRSLAELHPKASKSLTELRDQIQRSLDEVGPKQDSYDEKEDDLIFLEYKLRNKETRLYKLESQIERGSTAALSNPSSKNSSPRSRIATPRFTEDESSLAHRYLSRVGDANIVNERLMELNEERVQYLELEGDRLAMGIQYSQPHADFLAEFDVVYADHVEQLREINEDIQKLKPSIAFLSLDDPNNPRVTPIRAQSDGIEGIMQSRVQRRKSDGDLMHLSLDGWNSRHSISQWLSERLNISFLDGGRYHAIFDNADLDEKSWWRLVQDCWRTGRAAGLLRSSPGERSIFSTSATPRDFRGQRPSLTFNDGPDEFPNFSNYPVDLGSRDQAAAPDISWKSRAMSNYFDGPPSLRSGLDEESFPFHEDSEGSLRL